VNREDGCGQVVPLREYLDNFNTCPHCGRTRVMGAMGWISCLTDPGILHELYRDLTVHEILDPSLLTPEYEQFVAKQDRRTHFRESLVHREARVTV
jgi:acetyl-CoA carboxylase beta subunit